MEQRNPELPIRAQGGAYLSGDSREPLGGGDGQLVSLCRPRGGGGREHLQRGSFAR